MLAHTKSSGNSSHCVCSMERLLLLREPRASLFDWSSWYGLRESREVLVTLPVATTKYLRRGGVRREGLFCLIVSRSQSIPAGQAWQEMQGSWPHRLHSHQAD